MAEERKRLRVTFVVDLDDTYGELPEPKDCDDDTATVICEYLMEMLEPRCLIYGVNTVEPGEPVELRPVGWSVEAGGYGDMQIGTLAALPGSLEGPQPTCNETATSFQVDTPPSTNVAPEGPQGEER